MDTGPQGRFWRERLMIDVAHSPRMVTATNMTTGPRGRSTPFISLSASRLENGF
jgi:hypothetical protein